MKKFLVNLLIIWSIIIALLLVAAGLQSILIHYYQLGVVLSLLISTFACTLLVILIFKPNIRSE